MTTIDQTSTQPRSQRFYCEGCNSWHEAESLLEAVQWESEQVEKEKKDGYDDNRH
jgi:hypothetical protein